MKYIIIGNGIAGIEAAQAIRKSDDEGDVTIIAKSKYPHYFRPRLIEYLAGKVTLEQIRIFKEDFYEKNRIENILDTKIVSIDRDTSSVVDENGKKYFYDRLLIATGGVPFVPPIKGVNTKGAFTLRGITDSDKILDYCKNLDDIVVVGGGLLGLETAHSLALLGKKVSVIEVAPSLLPRQLDMNGGSILKKILEERGMVFYAGESVSTIVEEKGSIKSVQLESGKVVDADAVIISAGIRPKVELAENAGLDINRGIVVNDYLQTSIDTIFAAGDNAEYRGNLYGLWFAAKEQGKIAGLNMAGVKTEYRGTVMSSQLKIAGIDLYSAGDIFLEDSEQYVSKKNDSYMKFVVKDDSAAGAVVLGDKEAIKVARKVMEGKLETAEFKKLF